jgi:hypothetical protein
MTSTLDRVPPTRKSGHERFADGAVELSFDLLSFWRWSASDLLSNATRGILAEHIVARALGVCAESVRDEWAPYDLTTTDGVKVEVKSAAFLQSWYQERLSRVSFVVPKTREWDASTNRLSEELARQAEVYVFALLAHQDKKTIDPMDVRQWCFYVLPTFVLDARARSQHSITLPTLGKLCDGTVAYHELSAAVARAAKRQREAFNPAAPTDTLRVPLSS